jgi:nucleoside triphosphate diphosphatase
LCAWDLEQTFETIVPYTIEESYEIADAVARGDMKNLKEELGDLLLQVVFQARIAEERGLFDFGGVVEVITQKMIRRHPHVFGAVRALRPDEVKALWEGIKREEKSATSSADPASGESILADIPLALPGLTRAVKLQAKAATVGFDWNDARLAIEKIREETDEIEAALETGESAAIADEIGDLLFSTANLARHVKADPEAAIRSANVKFERRFRFIEEALAGDGRAPGTVALEEMEVLWNAAKAQEENQADQ